MNPETIAGIVAAGATVIGGLLALTREITARRSRRSTILQEIEILNALPENSASRAVLQEHIDRSIENLITLEETSRRGWTGIVLALIFTVGGTAAAYGAVGGRWWLWPFAAFLLTFGLVGVSIDWPKVPRDDRGRRLKPD
ncbi:hypothetical protein [Ilumatobacter sp.]|uniref:hypothetical protein n=1 Tax=Ilumatobacter sp. TaxID=1967498 RepID=UPI003750DE39